MRSQTKPLTKSACSRSQASGSSKLLEAAGQMPPISGRPSSEPSE
ncbi:MAG: hypothetical protein Q8P67_04040 [archaeon]|nr:hypothetical protein [archaeon]